MAVEIKKVNMENKSEVKKFIRFNYELYKDNPYSVPDLLMDMYETFDRKRNDAFEFCDGDLFLAYRDGKIVGRIACMVNHRANKKWNENKARFGWIDFIDDEEVCDALMATAEQYGRDHGCNALVGPLGFTDMDPEGMLVEGFDQLSTMSTIYNYDYYPRHIERLGYKGEADWLERRITIPQPGENGKTEKFFRIAELVAKRSKVHVRKFKSINEVIKTGFHYKIFNVVNKAYANLFGYSEMTPKQIDKYANQYLQFLDLDFLTVIVDENEEAVGMGACMGSLSHALQKAHGKLLPFGWWHLVKALKFKHSEYIDLLLIGVLPEYQRKGVNALIFADMIPIAIRKGYRYAEVHPILETNAPSATQFDYFEHYVSKRRRCYHKDLV